MKNDLIKLLLSMLSIVLLAALEEMLPKVLGVGFPLLLALTVLIAPRSTITSALLIAVASGAFEDSLSSLPFATSMIFFALAAIISRKALFPYGVLFMAYPMYQLWLTLWVPSIGGAIFGRIMNAGIIGFFAMLIIERLLIWLERRLLPDEV